MHRYTQVYVYIYGLKLNSTKSMGIKFGNKIDEENSVSTGIPLNGLTELDISDYIVNNS